MAQHDFVPAWLNFSTSQHSAKSSSTNDKHGDHFARGDGRFGVSRRRHNSSDGFFSNGLLRAAGGVQVSDAGSQGWKENAGWHNVPRTHDGVNHRGSHRHWNGNFHNRKSSAFQDKPPCQGREKAEIKEEKKEEKDEKLQFEEEDFPSLNPDAEKQPSQSRPVSTPAGVWENPPSAKQPVSKMLVIRKVLRDEPIFLTSFSSSGNHLMNSNKNTVSPSVYKNLIPKPAAPPTKPAPWKASGRENKPGLLFSGQDSAFTSPIAMIKPSTQSNSSSHISPKETPSSTTPPMEMNATRLIKMTRVKTDKKSEFLKALKDDRNGEVSEHRDFDKSEEECIGNTPEPKENGEENGNQHGLSFYAAEKDYLSSSLEAEHRLLKEMGWQEHPDNDDSFLPLTEDELREFQAKTKQLEKNGCRKNGSLLKNRCTALQFTQWRGTFSPGLRKVSDSETSSSDTSDDDV
ncbi:vasculin-like protein 1 isoform X2 [Callorhinchus milii]|uniref:vasculin-like protein 1 isoform X2 n=1 Tax=Callorhinchus milii TaxID=7868 RepID=UPI0004571D3A|nr:vasculin-like protein 1 isoform X2 [Callorhinchus milii]|eukprot:gi/632963781/ref/XP_007898075.1/ PREDICTED: vasculin-like protein 1 isoform X2 [Callorhinchus milii]